MGGQIQWQYRRIAILWSVMLGLVIIYPVVSAAEMNKHYLALSQEQGQILWLQTVAPVSLKTFNGQTGALEQSIDLNIKPEQLIMGFTPDGFKVALLEPAGLGILHRTGKTLRTLTVPHLPKSVRSYQPATAITNAVGTAQLFHDEQTQQLRVIHTGNGKELATVELPKAPLLALGLDAKMNKLAFVTQGKAGKADLQVYDLFKKTTIKTYEIQAPVGLSQPVIFSQEDKYLALLPQVINLQTGEVFTVKGAIGLAAFTTQNETLLFASQQGLQRLDLRTKQQQPVTLNLPAHCHAPVAYDWSADQQGLAFASLCNNDPHTLAVVSFLTAKTGQWQRNVNLAKP